MLACETPTFAGGCAHTGDVEGQVRTCKDAMTRLRCPRMCDLCHAASSSSYSYAYDDEDEGEATASTTALSERLGV